MEYFSILPIFNCGPKLFQIRSCKLFIRLILIFGIIINIQFVQLLFSRCCVAHLWNKKCLSQFFTYEHKRVARLPSHDNYKGEALTYWAQVNCSAQWLSRSTLSARCMTRSLVKNPFATRTLQHLIQITHIKLLLFFQNLFEQVSIRLKPISHFFDWFRGFEVAVTIRPINGVNTANIQPGIIIKGNNNHAQLIKKRSSDKMVPLSKSKLMAIILVVALIVTMPSRSKQVIT